jgi:hypothetical protein
MQLSLFQKNCDNGTVDCYLLYIPLVLAITILNYLRSIRLLSSAGHSGIVKSYEYF